MSLLPKEYLSIEDVAEYLDSLGHTYDLESEWDCKKLCTDIYDFVCQDKITAVFHYCGYVQVTESIYENLGMDKETGSSYPIEVDNYTSNSQMNDFFVIDTPTLKTMFIEHRIVPLNGYFDKYKSQNPNSNTSSIYRIESNEKLSSSDIRIPSKELKTLFNKNTNDTNESLLMGTPAVIQGEPKSDKQIIAELKVKVAELENKLEQAQSKKSVNQADDLKTVPHQSYRTVDRIMYAMAKLSKKDNSSPTSQNIGSLNEAITTILHNDSVPLEYEAVGKWLKRVNEIRPIKN